MIFRVNYNYAAPNGALRSGANLQEANDADEAKRIVRDNLIGKLKYLQINGATPFNPDQQELNVTTKQKK